jgi:hypothetical protein
MVDRVGYVPLSGISVSVACRRVQSLRQSWVGRHKAKLSISQADLPYQKEFRQLATKSSSRFMT